MLRRVLAGLILCLFGVALAAAMIEAGVRMLHLVPTRFWRPDDRLGSRLIAGKQGWWTQEEMEFRVPVRINRAGWRDVDHALDKPRAVARVLLLGDSFIEAMQVPLEDTIGRRLEQGLNRAAGGRYEVITMGASGYGTAGELMAYRDEGRAYRPDVVVLAFYPGNDVRNNSGTLEPTLVPHYDPSGDVIRIEARGRDSGRPTPGGWLARSQAYVYARRMLLRQPGLVAPLVAAGWMKPDPHRTAPARDGVPVDYWVYAQPLPPEWEDAWQRTENLLSRLQGAVEADGARFAMFIVTARERTYPETWREILAANPAMQSRSWDLGAPEERVLRWCARSKVLCLQLSEVFSARAATSPPLHFRHDGHWTAAGHALAAETLVDFLRRSGRATSN